MEEWKKRFLLKCEELRFLLWEIEGSPVSNDIADIALEATRSLLLLAVDKATVHRYALKAVQVDDLYAISRPTSSESSHLLLDDLLNALRCEDNCRADHFLQPIDGIEDRSTTGPGTGLSSSEKLSSPVPYHCVSSQRLLQVGENVTGDTRAGELDLEVLGSVAVGKRSDREKDNGAERIHNGTVQRFTNILNSCQDKSTVMGVNVSCKIEIDSSDEQLNSPCSDIDTAQTVSTAKHSRKRAFSLQLTNPNSLNKKRLDTRLHTILQTPRKSDKSIDRTDHLTIDAARNLMAEIGLSTMKSSNSDSFEYWLERCGFTNLSPSTGPDILNKEIGLPDKVDVDIDRREPVPNTMHLSKKQIKEAKKLARAERKAIKAAAKVAAKAVAKTAVLLTKVRKVGRPPGKGKPDATIDKVKTKRPYRRKKNVSDIGDKDKNNTEKEDIDKKIGVIQEIKHDDGGSGTEIDGEGEDERIDTKPILNLNVLLAGGEEVDQKMTAELFCEESAGDVPEKKKRGRPRKNTLVKGGPSSLKIKVRRFAHPPQIRKLKSAKLKKNKVLAARKSFARRNKNKNKLGITYSDYEDEDEEEDEDDEDDEEGEAEEREGDADGVGTIYNELESHNLRFLTYRCFICMDGSSSVEYPTRLMLYRHIREAHVGIGDSGLRVIRCPLCATEKKLLRGGMKKTVLGRVLSHLVCKHGCPMPEFILPFRCEYSGCSYVAIRKNDVVNHAVKHTGAAKVSCDRCGRLMSNITALRHHHKYSCLPASSTPEEILNVSQSRERFYCNLCDKSFFGKHALERHVTKKHEGRRDFLCTHCTSTFGERRELIDHAFRRHKLNITNKPIVSCPECPFQTIMPSILRRHHSLMHTDANRPQCPICSRVCRTPWTLKRHLTSHGEKNEKCHLCPYASARRSTLDEHIKAQHIGYQYQCDQCGYTTGYYANLCKHRRQTCKKWANPNTVSLPTGTPATDKWEATHPLPLADKWDITPISKQIPEPLVKWEMPVTTTSSVNRWNGSSTSAASLTTSPSSKWDGTTTVSSSQSVVDLPTSAATIVGNFERGHQHQAVASVAGHDASHPLMVGLRYANYK